MCTENPASETGLIRSGSDCNTNWNLDSSREDKNTYLDLNHNCSDPNSDENIIGNNHYS